MLHYRFHGRLSGRSSRAFVYSGRPCAMSTGTNFRSWSLEWAKPFFDNLKHQSAENPLATLGLAAGGILSLLRGVWHPLPRDDTSTMLGHRPSVCTLLKAEMSVTLRPSRCTVCRQYKSLKAAEILVIMFSRVRVRVLRS